MILLILEIFSLTYGDQTQADCTAGECLYLFATAALGLIQVAACSIKDGILLSCELVYFNLLK